MHELAQRRARSANRFAARHSRRRLLPVWNLEFFAARIVAPRAVCAFGEILQLKEAGLLGKSALTGTWLD